MAGFFNNLHSPAPGKGVSKSEPQKNAFFEFFSILKEKFWNISLLNLMFVAVLIPVALICSGLGAFINRFTGFAPLIILSFLPVVLLSPVWAAVTRITRDYTRREPCFFWQDFKGCVKNNWKQCLAVSLLSYLVFMLLIIAIPFYWANLASGWWYAIPFGACVMVGIVFVFMQYYLYMMIVTLDLKLRELFKNALIFSFACLFRNLFMTMVLLAFTLAAGLLVFYSFIFPILFVFSLVLIAGMFFGLVSFFISFNVFPQIQKYILDPYYEEHPEQSAEAVKHPENFWNGGEGEETPEYVYYNGKMVHRSLLEEEQVFHDDSAVNQENNSTDQE